MVALVLYSDQGAANSETALAFHDPLLTRYQGKQSLCPYHSVATGYLPIEHHLINAE